MSPPVGGDKKGYEITWLFSANSSASRLVIAWQLSNTLDESFCLGTLLLALQQGQPEIFNTDQGVQFTAHAFTGALTEAEIRISMDGRGRPLIISLWNVFGARSNMKIFGTTTIRSW